MQPRHADVDGCSLELRVAIVLVESFSSDKYTTETNLIQHRMMVAT